MKINPPSSVRTALYVLSVALNTFMAVLLTGDMVINIYILASVSAFNAVVALMAGVNVNPEQ